MPDSLQVRNIGKDFEDKMDRVIISSLLTAFDAQSAGTPLCATARLLIARLHDSSMFDREARRYPAVMQTLYPDPKGPRNSQFGSAYGAWRRSDGQLSGMLWYDDGEIGFFVRPVFQGTGLGTEMIKAFSAAFSESSLEAWCIRDNRSSERVLEKSGFEFERLAAIGGRHRLPRRMALVYRRRADLSAIPVQAEGCSK